MCVFVFVREREREIKKRLMVGNANLDFQVLNVKRVVTLRHDGCIVFQIIQSYKFLLIVAVIVRYDERAMLR